MGQGGQTPTDSASKTPVAADVVEAFGAASFADEGKGDFALAARYADAALAAASGNEEIVDTAILRAVVHLLQGEPGGASPLLDRALELAPDDSDRCLRALSYRLLATHLSFNTFPDGNGAGADEISARWRGAQDLLPMDTRWQEAMRSSTDPNAQTEAWLVYSFLAQLQPQRYTLEGARYSPSVLPQAQAIAMVTGPATKLHEMAEASGLSGLAAFADWAAADLHRRGGDLGTAHTLLERARIGYRAARDRAGEALCVMTAADWAVAPFSSPLVWNLACWDSSSASSALSVQAEAAEFSPGSDASYDEAESLFREADAPRGLAAIALRRGYQAMLRDDWGAAAAFASTARDDYSVHGDQRGRYLASTHLLMCQLGGRPGYT